MSVDCIICNVIVIGMNFMSVLESPSWHLDSSNNRNCLIITTSVDYCGTTCTHTHTHTHTQVSIHGLFHSRNLRTISLIKKYDVISCLVSSWQNA